METKISVNKKYESVVKEWQQALRSGEYNQTTGILVNDEGYCCLGVFCKIHKLPNYSGHADFLGYYHHLKPDENINQKATLFNDFLKITMNNNALINLQNVFISLNDNDEQSFSEIADWIDNHIEFV